MRPQWEVIGFIKLRSLPEDGVYEIVYVIGEEALWGHGYGESAIRAALAAVFGAWRGKKVIAKIYPENQRSIHSVCACGFRQDNTDGSMLLYRITMDAFLQLPRDRTVL